MNEFAILSINYIAVSIQYYINQATMLCFICTDANVPRSDMKELLEINAHTTFNAISVDGDTSTNDTVMLLANGKSNVYDKTLYRFKYSD